MSCRATPAATASACTLAFVLLYAGAVLTQPGQQVDARLLGMTQQLAVGPLQEWVPRIGRGLLPVVMAVAVVAAGAGGLLRRDWPRLVEAALVVLVSVPLSPFIRDRLPRPDHGYGYGYGWNTLPSTHVAAVAALALAIVILIRQRPRWLDRLLVVVVAFGCIGSVVGHAHRPSDALAAVLLVGAVAGGVTALTRLLPTQRRVRRGSAPT